MNTRRHQQIEDISSDVSDEMLVERTVADKKQFSYLIERYEKPLFRYLYRCGVSIREDREDILQNVFMNVYKNIQQFDMNLSFSSWIYRITHNEAMTFFRKRKAHPQIQLDAKSESWIDMVCDETADTSKFTHTRLSSEIISRELSELTKSYRDILILRFFEDRSYMEISDILKMSIGTVSTTIHRAKRAIGTRLTRYTLN